MNVHGVYDTSAYMLTFESRSEYRSYIQQEAGVSGSIFGFYAGVKEAYGSSSSGASQTFLSVLYVDVDRLVIEFSKRKVSAHGYPSTLFCTIAVRKEQILLEISMVWFKPAV